MTQDVKKKLNKNRWFELKKSNFINSCRYLVYSVEGIMIPVKKINIIQSDKHIFTLNLWGRAGWK
jgi:hypothetical protein